MNVHIIVIVLCPSLLKRFYSEKVSIFFLVFFCELSCCILNGSQWPGNDVLKYIDVFLRTHMVHTLTLAR